MSFSSRRRNYLLTPHRRDGLIEWMKSMLQHSFVLDALETTGADTFSHFEMLVEEHRHISSINAAGGIVSNNSRHSKSSATQYQQHLHHQPSKLQRLVPTIGVFHTALPLRRAFEAYNKKHRLTKRKHIQISFNEIRHILNLAQIMALCKENLEDDNKMDSFVKSEVNLEKLALSTRTASQSSVSSQTPSTSTFNGPRLISFDGDQTLYSDGANFESNPRLANYLYLLLKNGCNVAVVTAAGYEYNVEKYEYRLSGLLHYFKTQGLTEVECEHFYLFGGECNYLLQLREDYHLHPVKEFGPGGWMTATRYLSDSPANWDEEQITTLLDVAEETAHKAVDELNLRGRVIRKRRSVGLVPNPGMVIPRESLDELVLRTHERLQSLNEGQGPLLPYCAFNGGSDAWIDVGNKRVGVEILQSYCGIPVNETLHIGDQFLNTGNDFAARAVSPCIWIINPQETTYILKSILRLAGINMTLPANVIAEEDDDLDKSDSNVETDDNNVSNVNFAEMERRTEVVKRMDVYTGEIMN